MITENKIKIYAKYGGDEDYFSRSGTAEEKQAIVGNEWYEIQNIIQDLNLIKNKVASDEYEHKAREDWHIETKALQLLEDLILRGVTL